MKENSIEKEIELLQDETNSLGLFFKCKGMEEYKIALEHILSDYKRVLKENEYMHNELDKQQTTINKYAKENEELKSDNYELNNRINDLLDNISVQGEYRIIFEGDAEFPDEATTINAQKYIKLEKLQELLEGRK